MNPLRTRYRILLTGLAALATALILLISAGLLYGPVKGLYHRSFRTPPAMLDPAIEPLSATSDSLQRQRFLRTYLARTGSYGLSTTVGSFEGTPIGMTILVKDGVVTLIRDYTRDSYGIREFAVQSPARVDLGSVLEEKFHPLSDRFPEGKRVFLRCYLPTGEIVYF